MSSSSWGTVKLGEVSKVLSGYAFKSKDFCESGVPVIKIKNITPPYVDLDDVQFVSKELAQEKEKYLLQYDDVLISMTGSNVNQFASAVGKVGRVKTHKKMLLNQRVGKFEIIDNDIYDLDFLYYLISTDEMHYKLALNASGAANQANISPSIIEDIELPHPSLPEQKAIAVTLSCLDDKIELNNHMNKTLEEMAQVIFKSWFVDFEPFQDGEFEDSELGMIPKGWRVGTLGEVIELYDSMRKPLSSRAREKMEKQYPYYGATSLMDYVEDYIFDGIYVLLGEDGTVVDNSGYPILQYVWGKFWVNNHAHILKGKAGFNEDSIFMFLKNTNVQSIVTGAVQLKINQANLKSVKIIIPDKTVITEYNKLIRPSFAKKRAIEEENQRVIEIRDTLLPKLMSGEITVPIEEVQ